MTYRIPGLLVALSILSAGCSGSEPAAPATEAVSNAPAVEAGSPASPCQPHIEVYDAEFWAKELGRPVANVQANHRINLWKTPQRTEKVGELLVGSRAVILEQTADAYRVRSPFDQSEGWISAIQVARTLSQNIETREPCE